MYGGEVLKNMNGLRYLQAGAGARRAGGRAGLFLDQPVKVTVLQLIYSIRVVFFYRLLVKARTYVESAGAPTVVVERTDSHY